MKLKLDHDIEKSYVSAKALANRNRIKILSILKDKELTFDEVYSELKVVKYKDTIYRYLEMLHKVGLVEKRYDQENKLLKYSLKTNELCFEI